MPAEPVASHSGTATILFTDLVGSTTLRTTLGRSVPRRTASTIVVGQIAKHRGTLHDTSGTASSRHSPVPRMRSGRRSRSSRRSRRMVSVTARRRSPSASGSAPATSPRRRTIRTATRWLRPRALRQGRWRTDPRRRHRARAGPWAGRAHAHTGRAHRAEGPARAGRRMRRRVGAARARRASRCRRGSGRRRRLRVRPAQRTGSARARVGEGPGRSAPGRAPRR